MPVAFGLGTGATNSRIDIGNWTVPSNVTYFAWVYRMGPGGGSFGRVFSRGDGSLDLNYESSTLSSFGDRWNLNYHTFPVIPFGKWVPISISGNTTITTAPPKIFMDGVLQTLSRVGAGNFWSTTLGSSMQTVVGNRANDNARVWDGRIAHFARWNVELTDNEHLMLANGALPLMLRPDALDTYYPLENLGESPINKKGTPYGVSKFYDDPIKPRSAEIYYLFNSQPVGNVVINCAPAALTITSLSSAVSLNNDAIINSVVAQVVLSGAQSAIGLGSNINATIKALNLSANTAGIVLSNDIIINSSVATLSFSGLQSSAQLGTNLNSSIASLLLNGNQAPVQLGSQVGTTISSLSISGAQALIVHDTGMVINAIPTALSISGSSGSVQLGSAIGASPATVSLTSAQSSVSQSILINATLKTLALNGSQSSILLSNILNSTIASFQLNGINATIVAGGIVPIKSAQSIDMTLYYNNISMDASGENIGMTN